MLRPFATMAMRIGEFGIGLSMWSYGWAVWDGRVLPRWLGVLGVVAGVVCTVWAVVMNEESARLMGGLALVTGWQVVVAAWSAVRETRGA
jgi:hypothetical protein